MFGHPQKDDVQVFASTVRMRRTASSGAGAIPVIRASKSRSEMLAEVSARTVTDMVERRTSLVLQAASMSMQRHSALTSEEPRREREFKIHTPPFC